MGPERNAPETMAALPSMVKNGGLQWGRSGMLRKPLRIIGTDADANWASMGPERNAPETNGRMRVNRIAAYCFNGAGAECSGNRLLVRFKFHDFLLLQWGRSGMLRKPDVDRGGAYEGEGASMGPERNAPETRPDQHHFRVALRKLQWGRSGMLRKPSAMGDKPESHELGFNGAGAECSGNPGHNLGQAESDAGLQWGRSGMLRKPADRKRGVRI